MTTPAIPCVRLKPNREKSVKHRHPWVFSGAVASWPPDVSVGSVVDLVDADGVWMARGLANPRAALALRIYTWQQDLPLDAAFFKAVAERSVLLRRQVLGFPSESTDAYRLVFSEADGLSGLIVDRYGDMLSVEVGTPVIVTFLGVIVQRIRECTGARSVWVSASSEAVQREGLDPASVACFATGESRASARENGLRIEVDCSQGQKTGYFLDQRENRMRVARYATGKRMLSAYCYTGGFELAAAAAGVASMTGIDRSAEALAQARRHLELNSVAVPCDYIRGDVPRVLRQFREEGRTFDIIVLDPPRMVMAAGQKEKGLRGYKDINRLAMELLVPGGILASFSCSGLVSLDDFRMVMGWASVDSRRNVRILETLGQPPDHPALAVFRESEYLKGVIGQVE